MSSPKTVTPSKPPSFVSKNATYIGKNFLPIEEKSKLPSSKNQVYLAVNTNFKSGKVKHVYDKASVYKTMKAAKTRGLKSGRSMTGKTFDKMNFISIKVSPKKLLSLMTYALDKAFVQPAKGVDPEDAVLGYYGKFKDGEYIKLISPDRRNTFPKHYDSHKWKKTVFYTMFELMRKGKITSKEQIDNLDKAYFQMYYGYKNPKKLMHKIIDGSIDPKQVEYYRRLRRVIYGMKNVKPLNTKIEKFLENRVLKGELTDDIMRKIIRQYKNLGGYNAVSTDDQLKIIKSAFYKK
jgi:hypothetical protein